jgi:hypothetical protein
VRFVVTGEWSRNRLLQTIVVLYVLYVAALWLTNALLYFEKMSLDPRSVLAYYRGDPENFLAAKSFQALLEVSHVHLFAMGMLLLVLTHLMLFLPLGHRTKLWLIVTPFASAGLDEGAGWLVRFGHPGFAALKVLGFVALEASLAALIGLSLWSVFRGSPETYAGEAEEGREPGS